MDTETKGKLTELRYEQELLREKVEGSMKAMKTENETALIKNESAVERLQSSNEKSIGRLQLATEKAIGGLQLATEKAIGELRTDFEKLRTGMEKSINSITVRVMGASGLLGAFIAVLQYFNK